MKFLCDVHIPYRLVNWLREQGIEATHVNRLPDQWYTTDNEICRYADTNNYIVVSKDIDFRHSHFLRHTPRKLIRVVLGNMSNNELVALFVQHLALQLSVTIFVTNAATSTHDSLRTRFQCVATTHHPTDSTREIHCY